MADKKSKSQSKERKAKLLGFEQELSVLEQAVERLEGGDLTLEDAISCYEKAFHSWKSCARILQSAQKRIEVLCDDLADDADGSSEKVELTWKPLSLKSLRDLALDAEGPENGESSPDRERTEKGAPGGEDAEEGEAST